MPGALPQVPPHTQAKSLWPRALTISVEVVCLVLYWRTLFLTHIPVLYILLRLVYLFLKVFQLKVWGAQREEKSLLCVRRFAKQRWGPCTAAFEGWSLALTSAPAAERSVAVLNCWYGSRGDILTNLKEPMVIVAEFRIAAGQWKNTADVAQNTSDVYKY